MCQFYTFLPPFHTPRTVATPPTQGRLIDINLTVSHRFASFRSRSEQQCQAPERVDQAGIPMKQALNPEYTPPGYIRHLGMIHHWVRYTTGYGTPCTCRVRYTLYMPGYGTPCTCPGTVHREVHLGIYTREVHLGIYTREVYPGSTLPYHTRVVPPYIHHPTYPPWVYHTHPPPPVHAVRGGYGSVAAQ